LIWPDPIYFCKRNDVVFEKFKYPSTHISSGKTCFSWFVNETLRDIVGYSSFTECLYGVLCNVAGVKPAQYAIMTNRMRGQEKELIERYRKVYGPHAFTL
jgi:hypothetical protein